MIGDQHPGVLAPSEFVQYQAVVSRIIDDGGVCQKAFVERRQNEVLLWILNSH